MLKFEGGAISSKSSSIWFEQNSRIYFNNNRAQFGESIFSTNYSTIKIKDNLKVTFNNNTARWYGGQPYSNENYDVTFDENGIVTCTGPRTFPICIHKQCFCNNIDHALKNATNNTIIKLTIDVILSSVPFLNHLQNISIIGQNNPTVSCKNNGGGLHFVSCRNCTIVGITWDGCGSKISSSPVLKIENSSSIKIQNCTFKTVK